MVIEAFANTQNSGAHQNKMARYTAIIYEILVMGWEQANPDN